MKVKGSRSRSQQSTGQKNKQEVGLRLKGIPVIITAGNIFFLKVLFSVASMILFFSVCYHDNS